MKFDGLIVKEITMNRQNVIGPLVGTHPGVNSEYYIFFLTTKSKRIMLQAHTNEVSEATGDQGSTPGVDLVVSIRSIDPPPHLMNLDRNQSQSRVGSSRI